MGQIIQTAGKIVQQQLKIDDFIRLQPETSVKENSSNLVKLIENDDVVVKKIKKSNY